MRGSYYPELMMKKIIVWLLGGLLVFFTLVLVLRPLKLEKKADIDLPLNGRNQKLSSVEKKSAKSTTSLATSKQLDVGDGNQQERIDAIIDLVNQGTSIRGLELDDVFQIGDEFFEIMELGSKNEEFLKDSSSQLFYKLRKFEFENRKVLEESEKVLSYKIESDVGFVENLKETFEHDVFSVAGYDGLSLLRPSLDGVFDRLKLDKVISLEFSDDLSDSGNQRFSIVDAVYDKEGFIVGRRTRDRTLDNQDPDQIPERYDHLLDFSLPEEGAAEQD